MQSLEDVVPKCTSKPTALLGTIWYNLESSNVLFSTLLEVVAFSKHHVSEVRGLVGKIVVFRWSGEPSLH